MPLESAQDPCLREIVGALVLGADHPISVREIRRVVESVAQERQAERGEAPAVSDEDLLALENRTSGDSASGDAAASPDDEPVSVASGSELQAVQDAFGELRSLLASAGLGIELVEVSGGYRLQTSPACGPWVRRMLNRGKPQRISRPMIETLAIIGFRQPIARSEIESIRGVSVGHVIKALMEMQLVRIVGRSDLPGRPFLFGTTATFLDHFGLKSLNELNDMQPGVVRTPPAEQRAKHLKKRPSAPETKPEPAGSGSPAPAPPPQELVLDLPDASEEEPSAPPRVVSVEVRDAPDRDQAS